jgi:hypothetical protein
MSAVLKIRSFKRIAEPGEDPEEYLDDVQMAAEAWENGTGNAAALEKSLLRFFRENLEPNYEASWRWGGLSKKEKTVWTTVKSLLLKKFSDPVCTGNDVNYEETNEILGLSQTAGQSKLEYLREAEHLHRKVRPVPKQTLAAAIIKGLADEQKRANASFALSGTTYDFNLNGAVGTTRLGYTADLTPDDREGGDEGGGSGSGGGAGEARGDSGGEEDGGSGGEEVESTGADGNVAEDMHEGEWRFGLFE